MPAEPAQATAQIPMRDLVIKYLPVDKLIPFARNARTHSEAQIEQIAASMREYGWTNPILIDPKGVIIAGHGRVMAAAKLSIKLVPTVTLTGLTPAQRRAYVLMDNKSALNAGWDTELLRLELGDLKADGFNLDLTGFDAFEVADIFATKDGRTDPDEAPPVAEKAVSRLGDVWLLGKHRITCGDSKKADDVARCLKGAQPQLMVTDPPYGVEYDPVWRDEAAKRSPSMGNRKDTAKGAVSNDHVADWSDAYRLFSGAIVYVWHSDLMAEQVMRSVRESGFQKRCDIIWAKSHLVVGRGHYHSQHEGCIYAVRVGKTARWAGDRKQTTLWEIDKAQKNETGHSTQKPVECMARAIKNHTKGGEFVYDPFVGSGTTIIACEQLGRRGLTIELNPLYVDVAARRWQQFTGKIATLEETGETFAQVEAKRLKQGSRPSGRAPKPKRERAPVRKAS